MNVYKASSIKELLSEKCLSSVLLNIKNIKIEHTQTNGLSGSKMYKLTLENDTEDKKLYLKINNLKEDWLAMVNNDTGRELTIFKEDVYIKLEEFISNIYVGYYQGKDSYAILMNDMSRYIKSEQSIEECFIYLDKLAKFHAKFKEHDVLNYDSLLSVDKYCNFLSKTKVNQAGSLKDGYNEGYDKFKIFLGKELFSKYESIKEIDKLFPYYPKTFLHGDYRPDNTLYINDEDIRFIDWANSGCGPCTLDLFWYMMTSVDSKIDKNELIEYYKSSLENYMGYEFTNKTWNTLLTVGILCSSKMYLPALIGRSNLEDDYDILNINYWIESLSNVLINIY